MGPMVRRQDSVTTEAILQPKFTQYRLASTLIADCAPGSYAIMRCMNTIASLCVALDITSGSPQPEKMSYRPITLYKRSQRHCDWTATYTEPSNQSAAKYRSV